MKQILTLVVVITVMSSITAQVKNMEEKPDQIAAQKLRELGNRWLMAIVRRDRKTLDDLLDKDVIVINSDGEVLSKSEEIGDKIALLHFAYNNTVGVVRVYQGTAVMTGTLTQRFDFRESGGPAGWSSRRYTFVWIKRGERWKIVAMQYTPVTKG